MKVLRITTLLDFGGQERKYISFTEKRELLKNDYFFAAIGHGGSAENILKQRGFNVHILNRKVSIKNLTNIWAVYKLIKKVKPDVVHTAAAEANFHGILAAKLAGVKYIIGEEIGIPNHSKMAQKIFRFVYKNVNCVVCVSQAVKDYLVKIKEIPESKGIVIYNPAESEASQFNLNDSDSFSIVYVGRLEKVKNVEMLIYAFSKVSSNNVKLVIVGDGRERNNLENIVNDLKLNEKISFTGFSENPTQYLKTANLFVLPSLSEGFGIAVVEAMLMKVPVLCSKVGGIPEFVENGKTGWLFDPNKENELIENLRKIIEMDSMELQQIGKRGFESVQNKFTKKKYIENLENLYAGELQ